MVDSDGGGYNNKEYVTIVDIFYVVVSSRKMRGGS